MEGNMPNWCSNNITIQGPAELIKSIWAAAQFQEGKEGSLLNAMVPMPEDIGDGWYDWSVTNWGTKWDVNMEGLEFELLPDGRAMIHGWFDSAWSPPVGAYEKFCAANDDVYICASYFEPGMSFIGIWDNEDIGDVCYDDVSGLIVGKAADNNIQLAELFDEFGVESWYDFDEEEIEDEA
jgi:hypothetical protein